MIDLLLDDLTFHESPMLSFFDPPTWCFNVISFVLSVTGTGLGIWALYIARDQLKKTLDAATAAQVAAERTSTEVRTIATLVDIERLSSLCREIRVQLKSSESVVEASRPLHELRVGLAQLLAVNASSSLLMQKVEWDAIIIEIAEVQRRIDVPKAEPFGTKATEKFMQLIASVDQRLHELSPKAAEKLVTDGGR